MTDAPAEVLDGEATEVQPEPEAADLVVRDSGPALAVTPAVDAAELVKRLDTIRDAADTAMKETVDYGVVPGTDKPTLFKPGAEKLGVLFQLDVQLRNEKTWGPGDHLTVVSHATVFHAPTGARLGYGEGICTTRERKYAYRQAQRECPECGTKAIIKGKAEYGGGFLCWKKKDGCGAKFDDNDQRITGQEAGEIENPDLPDLWNTVEKMASKRARVDAVLAVTGASALFTQDLDDEARPAPEKDAGSERESAARHDSSSHGVSSPAAGTRSDSDPRKREVWNRLKKLESDGQREVILGWIDGDLTEKKATWLLENLPDNANAVVDEIVAREEAGL